MTRLDLIVDAARELEREASLAQAGLRYATYSDGKVISLPIGTSAHIRATTELLNDLVALAGE